MDSAPGYVEYPGWTILVVGLLLLLAAVVAAGAVLTLRWGNVVIGVGMLLASLAISWWVVSPVTTSFSGQPLTCATASKESFARGNPSDATLNDAARTCRSAARRTLVEQALIATLSGTVAAGLATSTFPRRDPKRS